MRGVMTQMAAPQRESNFRHPHRHSGMARFRFFDRIHRERAERVGELEIGHGGRWGGAHGSDRRLWEGLRKTA
jgi:hypothetical protein